MRHGENGPLHRCYTLYERSRVLHKILSSILARIRVWSVNVHTNNMCTYVAETTDFTHYVFAARRLELDFRSRHGSLNEYSIPFCKYNIVFRTPGQDTTNTGG
jgi:hypothetical protein